jgi:hypothetical protein
MSAVTTGLWKGCLGGIGLAIVFFIISIVVLLTLSQTAMPPKIILFITIASGPIIGTFGFAAVLLWARTRAGKNRDQGSGVGG